MKTILVGDCKPEALLHLTDPDAPSEDAFERAVITAMSCMYSNCHCFPFRGTFRHERRNFQPDLALVARDWSHWFILEVELISHSLEYHVLPQVRAFRYGDPKSDCVKPLAAALGIQAPQARTLLHVVPRSVVVVANKNDPLWRTSLHAHQIQFMTVSVFEAANGKHAIAVDGSLVVTKEHLAFGAYSRTDGSVRVPLATSIPLGQVQIEDPSGASSTWTVTAGQDVKWLAKDIGTPTFVHGETLQIIRTFDGRLMMRRLEAPTKQVATHP